MYSDFNKVRGIIKKKSLDGNKPTVEQIEICSCVIVTGLPPIVTKDTIMYYFERRKNNGGMVSTIDFSHGEDFLLVYFQDS